MIVLCGKCGADLSTKPCTCRRSSGFTTFEGVVLTAATMPGGVNAENVEQAARALRGKAS